MKNQMRLNAVMPGTPTSVEELKAMTALSLEQTEDALDSLRRRGLAYLHSSGRWSRVGPPVITEESRHPIVTLGVLLREPFKGVHEVKRFFEYSEVEKRLGFCPYTVGSLNAACDAVLSLKLNCNF